MSCGHRMKTARKASPGKYPCGTQPENLYGWSNRFLQSPYPTHCAPDAGHKAVMSPLWCFVPLFSNPLFFSLIIGTWTLGTRNSFFGILHGLLAKTVLSLGGYFGHSLRDTAGVVKTLRKFRNGWVYFGLKVHMNLWGLGVGYYSLDFEYLLKACVLDWWWTL